MTDQHLLFPLSHAPVRRHFESSWDFVSMGGLGSPMKPRSLLVADASISGISWKSPPLLTEQQGNGIDTRKVVCQDMTMNVGRFSKPRDHPTLPSYETSVQQSPHSLLYATPDHGPQTRVKVPDNQFAVEVNSMADRALRSPFPRFDIHTSQFPGWGDHGYNMSEETHTVPMIPLSDDRSPTCSTSGATRLNTMPQERSEASRRNSEGGHLVSSSPTQLFMKLDQSTRVEEMTEKPYQCRICRLRFSQRQGLTRHHKDTHLPKKGCAFCVNFTWPQGRRYIYGKHLQEEHPGFVLLSVSATPKRRRVKLKGQHDISIARRAS